MNGPHRTWMLELDHLCQTNGAGQTPGQVLDCILEERERLKREMKREMKLEVLLEAVIRVLDRVGDELLLCFCLDMHDQ